VKAATVMLSLVVGLRKWFRWPVTLEKTKEEIPSRKSCPGTILRLHMVEEEREGNEHSR